MNKESSSRKRRHHKEREPAADEEKLFNLINELRKQCGLQEIKTQPGIKEYASMLINNFEEANLENEAYVIMSNLSFSDEFDNQTSAADYIKKWLGDPGKRPVLFGPGNHGAVVFVEQGDAVYISVVVVSFFH